jgi:hypothetical protein
MGFKSGMPKVKKYSYVKISDISTFIKDKNTLALEFIFLTDGSY